MRELKGIITEEELKEYRYSDILLLNDTNDEMDSGISGNFSGSGSYSWSVAYDNNGFTGISWYAQGVDLSQQFATTAELEQYIENNAVVVAQSVADNFQMYQAGCATYERINS